MDLGFGRFDRDGFATARPLDLVSLLVTVAARQASSPTAIINARPVAPLRSVALLAPHHGAFNQAMAARCAAWRQE